LSYQALLSGDYVGDALRATSCWGLVNHLIGMVPADAQIQIPDLA
jgi:hypothetical protein